MCYTGVMNGAREMGRYFTPEPVVGLCYRMLRMLDPETRNPRIIDPACGEGAFLSHALANGITTPDRLFGIEKDPEVASGWRLPCPNLFVRNGLLSAAEYPDASFDWVAGNPPFGTRCLEAADVGVLQDCLTIWREAGRESLTSAYPIEILFLERFLQLAKPSGYVAIVVPDGILANERLSYVREWLMSRAEVKAVVSLPQHIFRRGGASSKSSILLLRSLPHQPSPVLMAAVDGRSSWTVFAVEGLSPGERLDPAYHHPKYVENARFLETLPNTVRFGDLIEYTTYGAVGSREYTASGVRLITPASFVMTEDGYASGLDMRNPGRFVAPGSRNDPARSRLRQGDLLFANSGVGCIGRAAVFHGDEPCNISQHVNLIRVKSVEPEYLAVYLQTRFARLQIAREKCGVGACGINFDRIRSLLMPMPTAEIRAKIASEYRRSPSGIRALVGNLEAWIRKKDACRVAQQA